MHPPPKPTVSFPRIAVGLRVRMSCLTKCGGSGMFRVSTLSAAPSLARWPVFCGFVFHLMPSPAHFPCPTLSPTVHVSYLASREPSALLLAGAPPGPHLKEMGDQAEGWVGRGRDQPALRSVRSLLYFQTGSGEGFSAHSDAISPHTVWLWSTLHAGFL